MTDHAFRYPLGGSQRLTLHEAAPLRRTAHQSDEVSEPEAKLDVHDRTAALAEALRWGSVTFVEAASAGGGARQTRRWTCPIRLFPLRTGRVNVSEPMKGLVLGKPPVVRGIRAGSAMRRSFWMLAAATAWMASMAGSATQATSPQDVSSAATATAGDERAVLKQYCVACHNQTLKSGGVSLEDADLTKIPEHADLWERVVRKLPRGHDAAARSAAARSSHL